MAHEEVKKYEKYLDEVLRKDYLDTMTKRDAVLKERQEYEVLLVSLLKMQVSRILGGRYDSTFISNKWQTIF